jgi:cephalosporin-C deacetylase-like acetyl esterase
MSRLGITILFFIFITPVYAQQQSAQTAAALQQLNSYLNNIGYEQLAKRAQTVAAITTKEQMAQRQLAVKKKIIELVGGLPYKSGPVTVKRLGTVNDKGFTIENIAYESLPGYWVTANVYVPAKASGPFPAMIVMPGHGAGKSSLYNWAANFAHAGILTIAIDPMGQGERFQHYDPELGTSKLEGSGEHEHANQTALLVGQHIARYWFTDGMRAVDYLIQRKDVDPNRIGAFGCSGGGTATSYLAAMDPRISVAVASSYITSFKELLPGNGPQDAEQTIPGFLAAGLDFGDWVELVAPRPFAIVAFEDDFFPIAGAKWTNEEARRIYSLYGAEDKLLFIDGLGGHCNLVPVTAQVMNFLYKHLKVAGTTPEFGQYRPADTDDLNVTTTGQLSTSIGSITVEDLARKEPRAPKSVINSQTELTQLKTRLRSDIRKLAAVSVDVSQVVKAGTTLKQQSQGYRVEAVSLESEPGITLDGLVVSPTNNQTSHPAILWMEATAGEQLLTNPDVVRLVQSGNIVMLFHPRGVLSEPSPNPNQLALGQYMQPLLRSIAVGKTLVGMRVDDTLRAITWLTSRADVRKAELTVYAKGGLGLVALHAAALDDRISNVVIENTLLSYQTALRAGLHRNLSEVVIPGVLNHYDVDDLLSSISPRPVLIVNPVNAMGQIVRTQVARDELATALDADRKLKTDQRIRILKRGFRESLPFPLSPN